MTMHDEYNWDGNTLSSAYCTQCTVYDELSTESKSMARHSLHLQLSHSLQTGKIVGSTPFIVVCDFNCIVYTSYHFSWVSWGSQLL